MYELVKNILIGAGSAVLSVGVGYFRKTPVPAFSGKKFIKTIIIGAIVGGAYQYNPIYSEDVVVTFLENLGYVTVIDRFADLAWARIKGALNYLRGL